MGVAAELRLRQFLRRTDGVSAVEFAIVLPLMVLLYVGGIEIGEAVAIDYKTTLTAHTVADLATQYVSIDNAAMSTILAASSAVIAPFGGATLCQTPSNVVVTVSEVNVSASGRATIVWSDSLNGTARTVGQVVTLPSQLDTPNISLIWGEVTYSYTPWIGRVLTGTITIYENVFLYPRLTSAVARVNS
jgi:Flp pilus assembly protein TadG